MASLKEIRNRIQSIRNTQKITSAMRMVSVAKLGRAQKVLGTMLAFQQKLQDILSVFLGGDMSDSIPDNEYAIEREIKKLAIVVVASDSGLCGAFNANMQKLLLAVLSDYDSVAREDIVIFPIGRKALGFARGTGCNVDEKYLSLGAKPSYADLSLMAEYLMGEFRRGNIDRVEILFHHFKSMASQTLKISTWLPVQLRSGVSGLWKESSFRKDMKQDESTSQDSGSVADEKYQREENSLDFSPEFILEPSREELIEKMLPLALGLKLYAVVLDSWASEHAARSVAMKIATDNADDLLADLKLQYNKSRQSAITSELLDISGGNVD